MLKKKSLEQIKADINWIFSAYPKIGSPLDKGTVLTTVKELIKERVLKDHIRSKIELYDLESLIILERELHESHRLTSKASKLKAPELTKEPRGQPSAQEQRKKPRAKVRR